MHKYVRRLVNESIQCEAAIEIGQRLARIHIGRAMAGSQHVCGIDQRSGATESAAGVENNPDAWKIGRRNECSADDARNRVFCGEKACSAEINQKSEARNPKQIRKTKSKNFKPQG